MENSKKTTRTKRTENHPEESLAAQPYVPTAVMNSSNGSKFSQAEHQIGPKVDFLHLSVISFTGVWGQVICII